MLLWTLLLAFALLLLLTAGPRKAPPLVNLTAYTCDPLPALDRRGNPNPLRLHYTCRSGRSVIHQHGWIMDGSAALAWKACRGAGGLVRVWQYPIPGPYGNYVFQTSCADRVFLSYVNRAAAYNARQATAITAGWGLLGLSVGGLGFRILRKLRS